MERYLMLVLRYFAYVGGALLALLLVCAAMLPKPPASDSTVASASEGPTIRIHSERKWPERIVLDTNAPMPAPPVRVAEGPLAQPVPAEDAAKARTREAFAQLPPDQAPKRVAQLKKPEPKVGPRRRIARARMAPSPYGYAPAYYGYGRPPRMMQVAQQPHFGFFW
jgi:hypothetical protein